MPALQKGRMHEISGPSAAAFAFLMAPQEGEIVLCGAPRWLAALNPEGVGKFRDPNACLHVSCPLDGDALWAAETALRSRAASAVILQTPKTPSLTNLRRLQLAAEKGRSLGLMIVDRPAASSAAETRWRCQPKAAADVHKTLPDKGFSDFPENDSTLILASLYKNKRGTLGSWILDVRGEKDALCVDAASAGEPSRPGRDAGG